MSAVSAFLPCRAGSKRVPRKNVRPFAGFRAGLIELKLRQLLASQVDQVVISSDDDAVLNQAAAFEGSRVVIHERDPALGQDSTRTDELVPHAAELIDDGAILWTHVTSPFVDGPEYDRLIHTYRGLDAEHDSLMTVNELRGFIWDGHGPINYDRSAEKWPRTQTLEPLYEVNSAAFIAERRTYVERGDRIGSRPFLQGFDGLTGFDIDWPEDFQLAELLAASCLDASGNRRKLTLD